jgi:hypothetical protein
MYPAYKAGKLYNFDSDGEVTTENITLREGDGFQVEFDLQVPDRPLILELSQPTPSSTSTSDSSSGISSSTTADVSSSSSLVFCYLLILIFCAFAL